VLAAGQHPSASSSSARGPPSSRTPGAVGTAARIMPGEQAVAYEPATVGGAVISRAGVAARLRIPTR
jgi:hypothetical protein